MTTPITIVGNLTADPELRFTPSGKAVTNFTVAVNERVKNPQTQEWEDGEGSFYNCAVWGDAAENAAESLQRGLRVIVQGGLKTRSYDRKDGSKGLSVDITVDEFGPSLRWATAKVTRAARGGSNGGGNSTGGQPQGGYQSQGAPQGAPAGDPWAAPAGVGADEPPF
jgi:single-strand DNA-binding protein